MKQIYIRVGFLFPRSLTLTVKLYLFLLKGEREQRKKKIKKLCCEKDETKPKKKSIRANMVFKKLARFLINKYLKDYIEELEFEKFKLDLIHGKLDSLLSSMTLWLFFAILSYRQSFDGRSSIETGSFSMWKCFFLQTVLFLSSIRRI